MPAVPDNLSPISQLVLIGISTVIGTLVYVFGAKGAAKNGDNIVTVEADKLRLDLTAVVGSHREAIDHSIKQQSESTVALFKGMEARMRKLELSVADRLGRVEERLRISRDPRRENED